MGFLKAFAGRPPEATLSPVERRASAGFLLTLQAYFDLIRCGITLWRGDFAGLHQSIPALQDVQSTTRIYTIEQICGSVDHAAIWYWRQVLCLQRSAATTRLLRRFGIPAHLVIGTQLTPFKAHAWVEVNGRIVNDRAYMRELYQVIDVW